MKMKTGNLLLILAVSILVFFWMLRIDGAGNLVQALLSAKPVWLAMAAGMMGIYWLLEAGVLHISIGTFYKRQGFGDSLRVSMVGQLFNCITPFASGGQPVQAYALTKQGVPLGAASCALMVKFIVYQAVLTIYSSVTLLFCFRAFTTQINGMSLFVLAGFSVNAAVIAGLLCLCFLKGGTRRFLEACIRIAGRLRLVKDVQSVNEKLEQELKGFYDGFDAIRKNSPLIMRMILLTAAQLSAFFLIPWTLYRAFGLSGASAFSMLAAAAFVLNLTSFIPLPGAAGGAEFGFYTLFAMFFPLHMLNASVLLWRVATFYLTICVGMLFTAVFPKPRKCEGHIIPHGSFGPAE